MLTDYLEMDSKGIFPMGTEDRIEYLSRGNGYMSEETKKELKKMVEEAWPDSLFVEVSAPDEACNYMKMKYGCDLAWVPFCKSERSKRRGPEYVPDDYQGVCCYGDSTGRTRGCSLIVLNKDFKIVDIAVHEMIHAARSTMDDSEEHSKFKEIVADEYLFLLPAYDKLKGCFGEKADYALIRLRQKEVEYLASAKISSRDVIDYFKGKSRNALRFSIMCEKLGL